MSNYITQEGLEKLKAELVEIKSKLKEAAEKIKEAREMGDLSENAEYHEAKNEQSFLMGKEIELRQKIKNAQIIEKKCDVGGVVDVGCSVMIDEDGDKTKYEIVGSDESDPMQGRISIDSPIGSALIGHKKGDTIKVKTPSGILMRKIISVE